MSPDGSRARRDLAVALSLSNLWHLRHWSWLLNANNGYYMTAPLHWSAAVGCLLGVLGVGAAFFLLARLVRRLARPWLVETTRVCFVVACLLSLNAIRHQAKSLTFETVNAMLGGAGLTRLFLILGGALMVALLLSKSGRRATSRGLSALVLCLAPLVVLTGGQALWAIARYEPWPREFQPRAPAALLATRPADAPRVLLIVFDGLDQGLAFDHRPPDLALPEFDRLQSQSVHAANAFPPSQATAASLPALITGLAVSRTARAGPSDLRLRLPPDGRWALWSQTPNVFDRARELGVNSFLVGWYHPYCRVLGSSVAACEDHTYLPPAVYSPRESARRHLALLLETVPGSIRFGLPARLGLEAVPPGAERRWHLAQYHAVGQAAVAAATERRYGLVFAHYPIPHRPFVYDRRSASAECDGPSTYLDNLALADRALGDLRRALEQAGLWDATSLIITSDHGYRTAPAGGAALVKIGDPHHRVPFVVKSGSGGAEVVCQRVFRTHHAGDLVLAILAGVVRGQGQVARWMDEHSDDPLAQR